MARRKQTATVEQTGEDWVEITHTDGTTTGMALHVWRMRSFMIKQGLESELRGMRMTRRSVAPSCYTIIREEFGIRGRDKLPRLFTFCHMIGVAPSEHTLARGDTFEQYAAWCTANEQEPLVKVIVREGNEVTLEPVAV